MALGTDQGGSDAKQGLAPPEIVALLRQAGTEFSHSRLGSDWTGVDVAVAHQGAVSFVTPKLDCHFLGLGLGGTSVMSQDFDALVNPGPKCFHPGALYFAPAGFEVAVDADASEVSALQIMIDRRVMDTVKEALLKGDPAKGDLLGFNVLPNTRLQNCARTIQHELMFPSFGGAMLVDTMAQAICIEIVRHFTTAARRPPNARVALSPAQLKRATEFMETHLGQKIGIRDVAEAAGASTYHFARAFKLATGRPPHQYLVQRRVEHAQDLLARSSDRLADIAYACGFSSQAHFTTTFVRAFGTTPGAYRDAIAA